MKRRRDRRSGVFLVMLAVGAAFFFLLAAGMVDWIYIYAAKARLVTAVDAAAVAATRELVSGATLAEQQERVNRIVEMIFRANFPEDHMMSKESHFDPPVLDAPGPGMRRVRVTGHAVLPTFFMRVMGRDEQPIAATAAAVRRDSNIMLLLDRSLSMSYFGGEPWANLQVAAPLFVDQFSEQSDRMGLVFYATNGFVDYTIQYPKGSMPFKTDIQAIIDSYSPSGWTNIALPLYLGYKELKDLNDPDALPVIVLFTDGNVTAMTNQFPVNTIDSGAPNAPPWCEATSTEPASPRWGTIANPVNPAEGPYIHNTPPPPEKPPILNCYRRNGSGAKVSFDPFKGQLLVTGLPGSWQPQGWTGTPFSAYHPFNPFVPAPPVSLSYPEAIEEMGQNITLQVADRARQDGILIYTIGLGPDVSRPFMEAIANDPDSSFYNLNQPAGEYIFAETPDQLVEAFLRVAANVTHLTQ